MKKFRIPLIAYDGWKFIFFFGFVGFLFLFFDVWFGKTVGALCVLFAGFCVAFFRDPDRDIPATDGVLSPADGTVMEVVSVDGEGYGRGRVLRIFLSVFDGHVQRSPVSGTVKSLRYMPGVFLDARDPRAPFANESNSIEIESEKGRVMVKQISGLLARRIVCWVRQDDVLEAGERIGLIRFGSQVDLYLPAEAEITVKEGDRVVAGQTVVAQWSLQAKLTTNQEIKKLAGLETKPNLEMGEKR
jgi:phosphatidylserine decarboxylase